MSGILAIDQGTTSTRAMLFDPEGRPRSTAARELPQIYPASGLVEHDPEAIWQATLDVCRRALDGAGDLGVQAVGIANQRETAIVWERATGKPVYNAIVWQDRRTADRCAALAGHAADVAARTGLEIDPYFSATKIAWILDRVPEARARAEAGELAFGTVDAFLLWRLTGGRVHATDATNASRTMLFNIHTGDWDDHLLSLFGVPRAMLPAVRDNAADFGTVVPDLFGLAVPVAGMAGDQHAATVGQACLAPGMVKATFGTGCFVVMNTGDRPVRSRHRLLTTLAFQLRGRRYYALEGSIFIAGAAVQWLRDGLGVIARASEAGTLARGIDDSGGVMVVPAFTGLGAPHWDPAARGAIFGLSRQSGAAEIVRATLESISHQTADLLDAMTADAREAGAPLAPAPLVPTLRVDGGMAANDWLMQDLANMLNLPVERPAGLQTTALGAAFLAGLQTGLYGSTDDIAARWQGQARFTPDLPETRRAARMAGWRRAVAATRRMT